MATQNPFNPVGVVGSDNHAPQFDPNGRWTRWNMSEIYVGEEGLNKYVPKVEDLIEDTILRKVFKVTYVDPMTLIPTWVDYDDSGLPEEDFTSSGPETHRVYLDTDVFPYALSVDSRYKPAGSSQQYAKIFRGSDTTSTGNVISFLFNSNGTVLTNQIPLEIASIDGHTNIAMKVVAPCQTKELVPNGERVTVVTYSNTGGVVARQQMIVEHTAFQRDVGAPTKHITHLSINSPFLSPSNQHELLYPLNVPLQAFNMEGVAHYNDGSSVALPVDGNKFKLLGMERFVATVAGQRFPLALRYRLDPSEQAVTGVSADGNFVTEPFWLVATPQNGAYSVKLYGYPHWVDNQVGYVIRWYMVDLNRDIMFDVSPYVRFNDNSDLYDPVGYNKDQRLSVRVNLREVSGGFANYIHTQTINVLLKEPGTSVNTNWLVGFDPQQNPYYGANLFAKVHMVNQNLWRINLANAAGTQVAWLQRMYLDVKPQMDQKKETTPPSPTHFVILAGGQRQEHPVSAWADDITSAVAIPQSGTLFIEWIRRTNTGDLHLAVTGLAIRPV